MPPECESGLKVQRSMAVWRCCWRDCKNYSRGQHHKRWLDLDCWYRKSAASLGATIERKPLLPWIYWKVPFIGQSSRESVKHECYILQQRASLVNDVMGLPPTAPAFQWRRLRRWFSWLDKSAWKGNWSLMTPILMAWIIWLSLSWPLSSSFVSLRPAAPLQALSRCFLYSFLLYLCMFWAFEDFKGMCWFKCPFIFKNDLINH